jgi:TPR repeat protein
LHKEKPTESALKHLKNAVDQGHPDAQTDLGELYLNGRYIGVGKDHTQARNYFMKAAQQNHPEGTDRLAWMFHLGEGGEKNQRTAQTLARKAAEDLKYHESYRLLSKIYREEGAMEAAEEASKKYFNLK